MLLKLANLCYYKQYSRYTLGMWKPCKICEGEGKKIQKLQHVLGIYIVWRRTATTEVEHKTSKWIHSTKSFFLSFFHSLYLVYFVFFLFSMLRQLMTRCNCLQKHTSGFKRKKSCALYCDIKSLYINQIGCVLLSWGLFVQHKNM